MTLYVKDEDLPPLNQRGDWRWVGDKKSYAGSPNLSLFSRSGRVPFTVSTVTNYATMTSGDRFGTQWSSFGTAAPAFVELFVRGSGTVKIDYGYDFDYTGGAIWYDSTDQVEIPPDYVETRAGGEAYIEEWSEEAIVQSSGSAWVQHRLTPPSFMVEEEFRNNGYTVIRVACVSGSVDISVIAAGAPNADGKLYMRNGDDRTTEWHDKPPPTHDWIPGSSAGRGDNRMWDTKMFFHERVRYFSPSTYPIPVGTAMEGHTLLLDEMSGAPDESSGSWPDQTTYTMSEYPAIYGGTGMPLSTFGVTVANEDEFYPPFGYIPPSHSFILPDIRDVSGYAQRMVLSPTFFEAVLTDPDHYPPGWRNEYTGKSTSDYTGPIWEDSAAEFLGWSPIRFRLSQRGRGISGDVAALDPPWGTMGVTITTSTWEPGDPLPAPFSGEVIWETDSPGEAYDSSVTSPWWTPPAELTWAIQTTPRQGVGSIVVAKESMDPATGDVVTGRLTYPNYARIIFQMPRWAVREYGWDVYYDTSDGGVVAPGFFPLHINPDPDDWNKVGNESWEDNIGRLKSLRPDAWRGERKPGDPEEGFYRTRMWDGDNWVDPVKMMEAE